jgi:hypothetical protein
LQQEASGSASGTEHLVELDPDARRVIKTTIPPAFGLVPRLRQLPLVDLRNFSGEVNYREVIEFFNGTPLEYLTRWIASNDVFGDDVQLASVVRWADGLVSFVITQPQYHGVPAEYRDIEAYFLNAGWERLIDPSHHAIFYNFAFNVIAIDAERRNCYLSDAGLQPFDVILCEPDDDLRRFLKI